MRFAVGEGVSEERIMLDPGIGFGKTVAHNLELIDRLAELAELGRPIVIGTSRKSFLGRIAADAAGLAEPLDAQHRLAGTIATNVLALERGAERVQGARRGPGARGAGGGGCYVGRRTMDDESTARPIPATTTEPTGKSWPRILDDRPVAVMTTARMS